MNLLGRLGAHPADGPLPSWEFGLPRFQNLAYWIRLAAWKTAKVGRGKLTITARWLLGTHAELVFASDIARCVWVAGCFEPNEFHLLGKLLRPGDVFVDVGANVGLYTLAAAAMTGPRGHVVAFEPSSRERELLQRNIALNCFANVIVDERALAAAPGGTATLQIADALHGGHNTFGSLIYPSVSVVKHEEVVVTTLDSALEEHQVRNVAVAKIDVEGGEVAVLRGASELLTVKRPIIMMELQQESLAAQGTSTEELLEIVRGAGYSVFCYAEAGPQWIRLFDELNDGGSQNIVAIPSERTEDVNLR